MTIPLAPPLRTGSSCQPGPLGLKHPCGDIPFGISPREAPIWHCSGWGLPCRFCCQSRGGLLPHRFTFSPANEGSLFSVALSLGLPPPGITRHPCFMESGLSSRTLRHPRSSSHPHIQRDMPKARWRQYAKRWARSAARLASCAVRGPLAQGRKRRRKAARSAVSSTCG